MQVRVALQLEIQTGRSLSLHGLLRMELLRALAGWPWLELISNATLYNAQASLQASLQESLP